MKILKELFRNKEKKTVLNFITMLCVGIALIIVSNSVFKEKDGEEVIEVSDSEKQVESVDYCTELENKLEDALSTVSGVGKVKVVLTLQNQGEIIVAEDNSIDKSESIEGDDGQKRKTNNIKQENKKILLESNKPLVLQEIKPKVEGVLIIAQGGGDAKVKSEIIKAIQALLNVESHKIEVLKMK